MIVVESPGLRTTVQDLGRPGFAHLGVPRSGAADLFSFRLANAIVGNSADAAALETTLAGPSLFFEDGAVVALTGAPVHASVDAEPAPFGRPFSVWAGQILRVGRASEGLRTYIGVGGGIDVPRVLGSRSCDTLSGLGPAALAAGDHLPVGFSSSAPGKPVPADVLRLVLPGDRPVRIIDGPGNGWFSASALEVLYGSRFEVSARADRVGARLAGPVIERSGRGEAPTAGMVAGAIQMPPDGAPIVLLADHGVTGGYPVAAVVAAADLPILAQSRPGTQLRFARISPAQARAAFSELPFVPELS